MHRPLFSLSKRIVVATLIGAILFTSAATPLTTYAQVPDGYHYDGSTLVPDDTSLFPQPGGGGDLLPPLDPIPGDTPPSLDGGATSGGTTGGGTAGGGATSGGVNPSTGLYTPGPASPQAGSVLTGGSTTQTGGAQNTTDLAAQGVSCSAGQLLGQLLSGAISSAISAVIGAVTGSVAQSVGSTFITVPTNSTFDAAAQHALGEARQRGGGFTLFGIFISVSWDSIAWCVVNAMIEYIANATIAWANSGFNGNPAFLQNPSRFFKDMADYAAGSVIQDIAYGASSGKLNICKPFRINIAIGLSQSYGRNNYRGMQCTLSNITQGKFFGGISVNTKTNTRTRKSTGISWSDWVEVTQKDQNNPYGAYILANEVLYTSIQTRQNTLQFEIGLNKGWLNFKKCPPGEKDQTKCDTVTPGSLIENQLNQSLGLSKQRLVLANKFDQMITAIVNNLIKVALNKIL